MSESKLIEFYNNKYQANNKENYFFSDIIYSWDDYSLEKKHDWIQWVFPLYNKSHYNKKAPILNNMVVSIFKSSDIIQKRIIQATIRVLNFYGFEITDDLTSIKQVKDIKRKEKKIYVGLYQEHNYHRITRILTFLNIMDMQILSAIFFLSMCRAVSSDYVLRQKIEREKSFKIWMYTQKYLLNNLILQTNFVKGCQIRGLQWTGNSCYMDSVLLTLFAIPNPIITNNILNKDLDVLKREEKLWYRRENIKSLNEDIRRRKTIQKELVNITDNMRRVKKSKDFKCSSLRSLIRKYPGQQEFHGRGTQDAGEFLVYLSNIFQVDIAKINRYTYGTNDIGIEPKWILQTTIVDPKASPIVDIRLREHQKTINLQESVTLTDVTEIEGWVYNIRKEVRVIESPYIVFYIHRLVQTTELRSTHKNIHSYDEESSDSEDMSFNSEDEDGSSDIEYEEIYTEKLMSTEVIAPEIVQAVRYKLYLFGIIIQHHAHYTCVFKCKGNWFYYDDTNDKITLIGSYKDMTKLNPNPLTNGVLYFYSI